ncbi:unnamed protein product [Caenorhabditis sp. 36 PRJEB53466]|nr:unnamed protein product [Caenorhabditis sp. 36 PRJEB53466]
MANLFRNLFGHKKSHSKGEDDNGNEQQQATLERDQTRRSHRPSSSASSSRHRGVLKSQDDFMLPPTAAYHTQNTQRLRKGPKSCPGEYVEEEPASSRSFAVDNYRHEEKHPRRRQNNNPSIPSSSSMMTSTSSHRPGHYHNQRWETSEYGSENTSPIGYHRHHPRRRQDEEDEEDEETEEEVYEKTMKYQDLKRKIRGHYEERLYNYERTQRSDHSRIKKLEKEKDDLVKMLLQMNDKLESSRKKTDYWKRKFEEAERQIKNQTLQQPNSSFMFGFPNANSQFQPFSFGGPGGSGGGAVGQRFSFLGNPMMSSSNTPTTSAMDTTTGGGAGESLAPTSDISFLTPLGALPPLNIPSVPAPLHSVAPEAQGTAGGQASNSFYTDDDDHDETKNFREEDMEVPRGSEVHTDDVLDEFLDRANSTMLIEEGKDSGFSTTPDDVSKENKEPKDD